MPSLSGRLFPCIHDQRTYCSSNKNSGRTGERTELRSFHDAFTKRCTRTVSTSARKKLPGHIRGGKAWPDAAGFPRCRAAAIISSQA